MPGIDEYQIIPRGPRLVDIWERKARVETSLGFFGVELVCDMNDTPDQAMLELAADCADFVARSYHHIAEVAFGHLQWALKNWGEELVFTEDTFEGDPLPRNTTVETIFQAYGRGGISIHHSNQYKSPYTATIGFRVPFDPEHGLRLTYSDGKIIEANDSPFKIVDGVMVHDWEE